MVGDVRKVTAAKTTSVDSVDGDYVIGRIESARLGGFPVLNARATREEGARLIKLGEGEGPHIGVNFRLALGGPAR
jgi:hypothetical protein